MMDALAQADGCCCCSRFDPHRTYQLATIHEELFDAAVARSGTQSVEAAERALSRRWPSDREARGLLELRSSPDQRGSLTALCSVKDGRLTLRVESRIGAGIHNDSALQTQVSVSLIKGTIVPKFTRVFILSSTVCHDDDIYCTAADQTARNKWVAVFRRCGVSIFAESEPGRRHLVEAGFS